MKKSLIILLCLLAAGFTATAPLSSEPSHDQIIPQQVSTAQAKVINLNPSQPNPGEMVDVTAEVISPKGIDSSNVELVYSYRGQGGTQTPIDLTANSIEYSPSEWDSSTELGNSIIAHEYREVFDYLTSINIDLSTAGGGEVFTHFEVSIYNLTTTQWEVVETDNSQTKTKSYNMVGVSGGVDIYVEYENKGQIEDPVFESTTVFSSEKQYTGTMPTPSTAAAVDYYIRAMDKSGGYVYSQNYTLYANNQPSLQQYNNLPTDLPGNDSFYVNTTIQDLDGVSSIHSVDINYKTSSMSYWITKELQFLKNVSSTDALYGTTINLTELGQVDEDLQLFLNITDVVSGDIQSGVVTTTQTIALDRQGPVLQGPIRISADPLVNYATDPNTMINLDMTFADSHGVTSANISYTLNNNNTQVRPLDNTSPLSKDDTTEEFTFIFPGYENSTTIAYQFLTEDFIGNSYRSPFNYLYVDNDGPTVIGPISNPMYPKNTTGATLTYNLWDPAGVKEQSFYYSTNRSNYNQITPKEIDYTNEIVNQTEFGINSSSVKLDDESTTNVTLIASPHFDVDEAYVQLNFTHSRPSDLRIELQYQNQSYLISDRKDTLNHWISLRDYFDVGLIGENGNLTLTIYDLKSEVSGTLVTYNVTLIDYAVEAGYSYKVTIPPQERDMNISYYFSMVDNLGNEINSSIQYLYLDGIPPMILNYTTFSSEVDLAGKSSVKIAAQIEDKGGVETAELYYKYGKDQVWNTLTLNKTGSMYAVDAPVNNSEGIFIFELRVYDKAGWETVSETEKFNYINANAPKITLLTDISGVIDLTGEQYLSIEAKITDDTGLKSVQIHYQINDLDTISMNMTRNSEGNYFIDIPIPVKDGTIRFNITATDLDNQEISTRTYHVSYQNAQVSNIKAVLPWIGGFVAIASLSGIGYLVYQRLTKPKSTILTKVP